jgi:AcrR family transcriptional regulator
MRPPRPPSRAAGAARRPGRPRKSRRRADLRAKLIESAAWLFAQQGYAGTPLRQIAQQARTTPAMVAYYFGDKEGLLEAVLDSVFGRLVAGVQQLAAEASADARPPVARFISFYVQLIAEQPWVPQLMVREVLSRDTPLRRRFVERFGRRGAQLLPGLLGAEIAAGRLRGDLDPVLWVLSLLGMCVFPFLAHPVIGPLLGYELGPAFGERLARHTVRLFLDGAQGEAAAP